MPNISINDRYEIDAPSFVKRIDPARIYQKVRKYLDDEHMLGRTSKLENRYAVGVPDCDDCICFHFEEPFWVVYYSERGARVGPAFFANEIVASEYFIRCVFGRSTFPLILNWAS